MTYERRCDLCNVSTRVDMLERVDVFPLGLVCSPCRAELVHDEDDPHAGEPHCDCYSVCTRCTPGA